MLEYLSKFSIINNLQHTPTRMTSCLHCILLKLHSPSNSSQNAQKKLQHCNNTYLNKFKWETFVKYTIDFCTARQFFGTDLRTCTFNSLLQILTESCHHSAIVQKKQYLTRLQFSSP